MFWITEFWSTGGCEGKRRKLPRGIDGYYYYSINCDISSNLWDGGSLFWGGGQFTENWAEFWGGVHHLVGGYCLIMCAPGGYEGEEEESRWLYISILMMRQALQIDLQLSAFACSLSFSFSASSAFSLVVLSVQSKSCTVRQVLTVLLF